MKRQQTINAIDGHKARVVTADGAHYLLQKSNISLAHEAICERLDDLPLALHSSNAEKIETLTKADENLAKKTPPITLHLC